MALRALLQRHLAGPQIEPELLTSASALLGNPPPPTGADATSTPAPANPGLSLPHTALPPPNAMFHTGTAGLVLLWPFLRRCFTTLELVAGDSFVSETARHRAIHLLHYMATGAEAAPEPALLLPKILCGAPWSQPIPATVALADHEKSEADALLRAAIQHWAKVSNSSIGGFRASFLIREGRLALAQPDFGVTGWELHIERKGHDILLDYLPWTLSLIKLPWLPNFITVQW